MPKAILSECLADELIGSGCLNMVLAEVLKFDIKCLLEICESLFIVLFLDIYLA